MQNKSGRGAGRSRSRGPKTARQRELTTKRRGELSELAFVYKAATQGFHVAKPYGDSERYDFIVEAGRRLWRIQVKATTTLRNGRYHVNCHRRTHGGLVPYRPDEIDFVVAHIIPEDGWFIVPVAVAQEHTTLLFAPRDYPLSHGLYDGYREAWHLLREK